MIELLATFGSLACLVAVTAAAAPDGPAATPSSPPAATAPSAPAVAPADRESVARDSADTRSIRIPKTTESIALVRGPAGPDGTRPWIGRTEITWDLYDIFVYGLDEPDAPVAPAGTSPSDATARPSKPYVPPDRGFGHHGYPAMGMTFEAAKSFCVWLSAKTGKKFRLPTEAEWEQLCLGDSSGTFACGVEASCLDETAWHSGNSDFTTKAVGLKKPNSNGLFDVHGNVAEWVVVDDGGKPLAKGGSFKDTPDRCAASFDLRQTTAWNASDPQIPKSKWWLADCSFVGFRVVMEE